MAEKTSTATKAGNEPAARGPRRESPPPAVLGLASTILGLQQTAGNRTVGRLLGGALLQPKLRIGPPGDVYEREADRVADAVLREGRTGPVPVSVAGGGSGVQRMCAECEEEKLQRSASTGEDVVQRQCHCEEEPRIQRKATAGQPLASGPLLIEEAFRDAGSPIEPVVRSDLAARLGHDFNSVRVHTDARAAAAARAVNALAFTAGRDVFFAERQYRPDTKAGRELLAHELVHVVQQRSAPASTAWRPTVSPTSEGGQRVESPLLATESVVQEGEANRIAAAIGGQESTRTAARSAITPAPARGLQLFELPRPVPICGALVTDIDVLPPRPRALTECGLPPSVMVTRVNIVGRARGPRSTGRGRIIFNLHAGWYRDPATRRLCGVISDSELCLTPGGCIHLGCFLRLDEVLKAIWEAVKTLLEILGIIILAIIAVLLLRGLRVPVEQAPLQPPLIASREGEAGQEPVAETA